MAPDNREELERQATRLRSRLATTLDALDFRRHELVSEVSLVRREVRRSRVPITLASVLLLSGWVAYRAYRARDRRQHPYRERWRALQRLWQHPEHIA